MDQQKLNEDFLDAVTENNIKETERLINLGADIHHLDNFAARYSAGYGFLDILKLLHSSGVPMLLKNNVLMGLAIVGHQREIIEYLKSEGVTLDDTLPEVITVLLSNKPDALDFLKEIGVSLDFLKHGYINRP